jgi:predicted oxidoreductase
MWHYVEGIKNWNPIWTNHAIRILPGPSSLWLDARGRRFPVPLYPGFDTLATLRHIMDTGYDYSWFVLNQKIIAKEFALSGSEQNPDLTNKTWLPVLERALPGSEQNPHGADKTWLHALAQARQGVPGPVQAFLDNGEDFIVERELPALVGRMNKLVGDDLLTVETVEREIRARDRQIENPFCKDMQVMAIRSARSYVGDELIRTAPPHKILDPDAGPLIAVRLNILTRKTLGGLQTDLDSRVLGQNGEPVPGLYAAGEVAGFGGGGMHGYSALEGTFLGGCIFSGCAAGRAAAKQVG